MVTIIPPRAARDVREAGIPLETFKIKSQSGRSIAAYKFGDLAALQTNRVAGRILFSKNLNMLYLNFVMGVAKYAMGNLKNVIYKLIIKFLMKLAEI